jgi:hypothetical protein
MLRRGKKHDHPAVSGGEIGLRSSLELDGMLRESEHLELTSYFGTGKRFAKIVQQFRTRYRPRITVTSHERYLSKVQARTTLPSRTST